MAFEINVDDAIAEATSKETFDVFEFVRGANTPEDEIVVYTDADAALKLAKIFIAAAEQQEKAAAEALSIDDDYVEADEDEINSLHERLVASGLIFKLKGLAPRAREAIENSLKAKLEYKEGAENEDFNETFNNTLIAKSIVSVTNAAGAVATLSWTPEVVNDFNTDLYASEANKLLNAVAEINYVGAIFDRAVNADFS